MKRQIGAVTMLACAWLGGCGVAIPNGLAPNVGGSVGRPSYGVLTGAVALPKKGPGFVRLRDNQVHYGTPRLIEAITSAAAKVADERPGGPRLVVGDCSKKHGGKAEGHNSHRSGRDVDLLYFATTPEGAPVESPGFVAFGPDGLAKTKGNKFVRLDVERQWLFVKALVSNPTAQVQWLFVSQPIEALLIEHARALGEDPALVWRAETVLQQPTDSAPHDDHMHMRIACSPADIVNGCEGGPRWPFLMPLPKLEMTEAEELQALLEP